jgi:DNA-binding transcriptional LysR family regulator
VGDLPELRLLRSFVVIAQEGSLSRAAEQLTIAQQSLSQQVRVLEGQIGAPVLRRSSRGVSLTAIGEVLLREALPVLGLAEHAMDVVAASVRGEGVTLRVGFLSSLANEVMPPVVRLLTERQPDLGLHTEDLSIAQLVAGVREGRLDAAVSRPPLIDDLIARPVGSEPVVIAFPEDHRLAGASSLRLADLADESWVMTPCASWPPWHRKYDEDFAAAGFRPRVVRRGSSPQGLLALVAAGVGITRLAASARSLRVGGVRFAELQDERAPIVLLTRPGRASPAIDRLHALVLEALGQTLSGFQPDTRDGLPLQSAAQTQDGPLGGGPSKGFGLSA